MQVYLAVRNDTHVLIGKKRLVNVFWEGQIANGAATRVNQAGQWVFPGGKAEETDLLAAAMREFVEETGVPLGDADPVVRLVRGWGKYTLVMAVVRNQDLAKIRDQANRNLTPSESDPRTPSGPVRDWELRELEMVKIAAVDQRLGVQVALPHTTERCLPAAAPHTQLIDWYANMATALMALPF